MAVLVMVETLWWKSRLHIVLYLNDSRTNSAVFMRVGWKKDKSCSQINKIRLCDLETVCMTGLNAGGNSCSTVRLQVCSRSSYPQSCCSSEQTNMIVSIKLSTKHLHNFLYKQKHIWKMFSKISSIHKRLRWSMHANIKSDNSASHHSQRQKCLHVLQEHYTRQKNSIITQLQTVSVQWLV